jgi:hypothetical protein
MDFRDFIQRLDETTKLQKWPRTEKELKSRSAIGYFARGGNIGSQGPYEKARMRKKVREYMERMGARESGKFIELQGKKIEKDKFISSLRTAIYSAERMRLPERKERMYIYRNLEDYIGKQK